VNPDPRDARQITNSKPTATSSLKIHRQALALAPALAERLAKTKWTVALSQPQKKDSDGEQVEYDIPQTAVRSLLASLVVASYQQRWQTLPNLCGLRRELCLRL
jgi:hypothetical protein